MEFEIERIFDPHKGRKTLVRGAVRLMLCARGSPVAGACGGTPFTYA